MADLSGIAQLVRISVPGCPEPLIADAIIGAAIDFCRQTRVVTEDVSVTTAAADASYPLVTSTDTRANQVNRVERDTVPLSKSSKPVFDANPDLRAAGTASHYYLDDNTLTLGPVPDAIETLLASVVVEPTVGATTLPDVLANEWRRVIAAGAKAFLLAVPGSAWQSLTDAANEYAAFHAGIDAAIFKRDGGGAGYVPRSSPSWC